MGVKTFRLFYESSDHNFIYHFDVDDDLNKISGLTYDLLSCSTPQVHGKNKYVL